MPDLWLNMRVVVNRHAPAFVEQADDDGNEAADRQSHRRQIGEASCRSKIGDDGWSYAWACSITVGMGTVYPCKPIPPSRKSLGLAGVMSCHIAITTL